MLEVNSLGRNILEGKKRDNGKSRLRLKILLLFDQADVVTTSLPAYTGWIKKRERIPCPRSQKES